MKLKQQEDIHKLNLLLDLKSFEELRFCVAKALSCTNDYKQ